MVTFQIPFEFKFLSVVPSRNCLQQGSLEKDVVVAQQMVFLGNLRSFLLRAEILYVPGE